MYKTKLLKISSYYRSFRVIFFVPTTVLKLHDLIFLLIKEFRRKKIFSFNPFFPSDEGKNVIAQKKKMAAKLFCKRRKDLHTTFYYLLFNSNL